MPEPTEAITVTATTARADIVGYDLLTPLLEFIFGSDGLLAGFSVAEVVGVLGIIWNVYVFLAYVVSAILLFLYVYASIHAGELDEEGEEHLKHLADEYQRMMVGGATSDRFEEMRAHVNSTNPNDWKLAIIEADIVLDETLKRMGYAGTSLGERLRSVSPQAMETLDDAWQAHKIRNEIAHNSVDFVLTQQLAKETIVRYERVFTELGILGGGNKH